MSYERGDEESGKEIKLEKTIKLFLQSFFLMS
jgi:hypothetical protein